MKKAAVLVFVLLGLTAFVSCYAQTDSARAKQFVALNAKGNFTAAQKLFASELQKKVSPGMLKIIWKKYMETHGTYQGILSMKNIPQDSLNTVMTLCEFTKARIKLALTFNLKHELTGYHINTIQSKQKPVKRENETDTTIHADSVTIAGSLLLPKNHKRPVPVALIIPGSGAVDRNGNSGMALQSNSYLMLADSLAAHGIASFRYDKRGVGKSEYDGLESQLHFSDFVNDAVAIIHFLKKDSLFSKVILIGHSQGSLTGMLAAEKTKVAAYISLEGAGEPIDQILFWQLSRKKDATQKIALRNILDSLKAGEKVKDVTEYPIFRPDVQPFLTSWMQFDPAKEIKKLQLPVLIINGTTDLQVAVKQAKILQDASPHAPLKIIEGMNHILKPAPAERAINLGTYYKPNMPLKKEVVIDIVSFINSL